jgi:hypothetical protein
MKKENPFLIKGYIAEYLFCDRQKETLELYGNVQNGINTTLISPRRMGKTGLILHFFDFLSRETEKSCCWKSRRSKPPYTKCTTCSCRDGLRANIRRGISHALYAWKYHFIIFPYAC